MKIGFVGYGNMGEPICRRLHAAGHDLQVFDANPAALNRARDAGISTRNSASSASSDTTIVFTCLPTPAAVIEAIDGDYGVLRTVARGAIIADLSTNDPAVIRHLASSAASVGAEVVDSPVAGGVPAAEAGTLTLFVGSGEEEFRVLMPVLQKFGREILNVGPPGAGSVVKLANNLLAFANLAAAGEAFLIAKRAGVEPSLFLRALEVGSGASAILERFRRKILTGDFSTEFALDLALKDVDLALRLGKETHVPMVFGNLVRATIEQARAVGYGAEDCSAIVRALEASTGDEIRTVHMRGERA